MIDLSPAQIERVLPYLSDTERAELAAIIGQLHRVWTPLPGPQLKAYMSEADLVGFGGAAGGGKSDWLLGTALTSHTHSLIMRVQAVQLPGLVQRTTDLLGSRDGYNGQEKIWRVPGTGQTITFGSAEQPDDWNKFQGRARDFLGLDEASNFSEANARALMGWVRTTDPRQRTQTGLAFNPPTNADGRWIIKFFAPWLDPKHIAPAMPGELRHFAMVDGVELEMPDGEPFMHKGELITPRSRTFIPSRIADNPFLMQTGYMDTLQAFPEPLRSQMLYGDFFAGVTDDPWQVIPTAWIEAAQARWEAKPFNKPPMDSMGVDVARGGVDNTVISRRHGLWFDELITLPGTATPDSYTTQAQVLTHRRDEAVVHIDYIGVGAGPYDLLRTVAQTVGVDGRLSASAMWGRLKPKNVRSQMWLEMRELLDPVKQNGIALPPDEGLLKELSAPKWEPYGDGSANGTVARVESREDIIKRLGYSPDKATAVCMAAMQTPKRSAIAGRQNALNSSRRAYNPLGPRS